MPSRRAIHHWTTANVGEAAPGVASPLSLAFWGEPSERAARRCAFELGVLSSADLEPPADPAEWFMRPFYGRIAIQVEYLTMIGDRMPGVNGAT